MKDLLKTDAEVVCFDTLDSTQDEVRRRLTDGFTGRLLVRADTQTDGRGRRGRSFFSPAGTGLYMTVAFPCKEEDTVLLTCGAAVAVCEALRTVCSVDAGIKWVNDIYYNGKKIVGILTERIGSHVAVGVGINLTTADFPPDIADKAGSVGQGTDKDRLCAVLADLLFALPATAKDCMAEYRRLSVIIGKDISYEEDGITRTGTVLGFSETGGLRVASCCGVKTLTSGEITVRVK